MVEDTISIEVSASTTERRPNPSAAGFVRSNPAALATRDTTHTVPDFLPIGSVAFPDLLLKLWKEVQYSSMAGLFPSISRVWLTVDNRLILWDYRNGCEFTDFTELEEIIVMMGTPVRPTESIFQPHVTLVLPVATAGSVHLLGLCVMNVEEMSDIKIVSLGYCAAAPAIVTKITVASASGRIFCAGANGEVYELRYIRESTPFVPRIRMICFSYLFSSRPCVGQITGALNMIKETWTGRKSALRDIVVDEQRNLVLTLDFDSTITAWRIVSDGLRYAKALSHRAGDRGMRRRRDDDDQGLSPLVNMFIVEPDQEGCTLVALAANGDQFRYRYLNPASGGGDHYVDLILRSTIPSYFPSSTREVGLCFASGTTVIIADRPRRSDDDPRDAEDELVISTSPKCVMEPHAKYRDVVATFGPTTTSMRIVSVDAIDAVPMAPRRSPNDLCSQVCSPPPQFMVLHRGGLAFYLQMRPVDTLFTIISQADAQCRDSLLQRFASTYDATDYATMLLQVAVGGVNVYHSSDPAGLPTCLLNGNNGGGAPSALDADGLVSLEHLGRNVMEGNSPEARRLARELLRAMATCSTQTGPSTGSAAAASAAGAGHQVTVIMSPFASSIVAYLARALYGVWEVPIAKLPTDDLLPVEEAVSLLARFLESIEVPSYSEDSLRIPLPHQWQQGNKVVVSLSPTGSMSSLPVADVTKLQLTLLLSTYRAAQKALQTVFLLRQTRFLPLRQDDRLVTVAQIVRDKDVALRLGQYFSQVVLSSQQGVGTASNERLQSFAGLQKSCPYFFGNVNMQEFQARSEIEFLTRGESLGTFTESELAQWTATVAPNAAAYWNSGALQNICQQLAALKKEGVAVQLLLHAARQQDPNNSTFALYLSSGADPAAAAASASGFAGLNPASGPGAMVYHTKTRIIKFVTALLEVAWQRHRSVVEHLLGGPRTSGAIWEIEPDDEMTHCVLFDWLRAPRADPTMTQTLRDTLVVARSPFLQKYLVRNRAWLGKEYAHYLRRSQRDYRGAIEQCVLVAQSPLPNIPTADRLAYRIRCLTEALECARECRSDQFPQVEQALRLLEAQRRLVRVTANYLNSRMPSLANKIRAEVGLVTERDMALQHIDLFSNYVVTASNMLQIAGMYTLFGGAEVQLDVLVCSNVSDAAAFAVCIVRAYELREAAPADITRRLVAGYYKKNTAFPISFVIRMQEAATFPQCPQGSSETVRLLIDECGVDSKVVFYAYKDIIEAREAMDVACPPFQDAGVTRAYLVHSMAAAVRYLCAAVRRGTLQVPVASFSLGTVQDYIRLVASEGSLDDSERRALEAADALVRCLSV